METNSRNSSQLISHSNKFKPLNIFVTNSQKEIFSNQISSILPDSILFKEEANENSNNLKISKYFFEKINNRYNVINLIPLNAFQSNNIFSSDKNYLKEDNYFIFKKSESFSEARVIEIFNSVFGQDIFDSFPFKEIGIFFEEKKKKKSPSSDAYYDANMQEIVETKNFEIFEKKISAMNLGNKLILIMLFFR